MKIVDINELNEKYKTRADFTGADAEYFQKIDEIKEAVIKNAATAPVILIAGPSGSGKTTTAKMLEKMLDDDLLLSKIQGLLKTVIYLHSSAAQDSRYRKV